MSDIENSTRSLRNKQYSHGMNKTKVYSSASGYGRQEEDVDQNRNNVQAHIKINLRKGINPPPSSPRRRKRFLPSKNQLQMASKSLKAANNSIRLEKIIQSRENSDLSACGNKDEEFNLIPAIKTQSQTPSAMNSVMTEIKDYSPSTKSMKSTRSKKICFIETQLSKYPKLTKRQYKLIRTLINGKPYEQLISKFKINITRHDLRTLLGQNWVNDQIINFYINLIIERSERKQLELPTCYGMNTFFMTRLYQSGYSVVKRWTRKVDIFDYDLIITPVHVGGVHWCLAVIDFRSKTIKYYDPIGEAKEGAEVITFLKEYLRKESIEKGRFNLNISEFHAETVGNMPIQKNDSDCGVFSCILAEHIACDRHLCFTHEDMPYFRQKMMIEILRGELLQ